MRFSENIDLRLSLPGISSRRGADRLWTEPRYGLCHIFSVPPIRSLYLSIYGPPLSRSQRQRNLITSYSIWSIRTTSRLQHIFDFVSGSALPRPGEQLAL